MLILKTFKQDINQTSVCNVEESIKVIGENIEELILKQQSITNLIVDN